MSPRKRWGLPRPSSRSKPVSSNVSPSDVMKVADVRAMTIDQLDDEVLKLKKEQFNLRFQRATGQLENTARVRIIRRDIARMKTIAAQKRVGAPEPAPKAEGAPAPVKKTIRRSKKYHAHDEANTYAVGDMVWIEERRPISKLKCWEVVRGEKKQKVQ